MFFSSFGVVLCKIRTKRNLLCYIFPRFRKKFHVSASRSSPIYFLVLLVWSNEKSFNILIYVFVRKILTCLLAGHPPFVFYIFWLGLWKIERKRNPLYYYKFHPLCKNLHVSTSRSSPFAFWFYWCCPIQKLMKDISL